MYGGVKENIRECERVVGEWDFFCKREQQQKERYECFITKENTLSYKKKTNIQHKHFL